MTNKNIEKMCVRENRDIRFDICKGIAIFLMVCGHTSIPEVGSKFIWLFHMPLFFIISGYFFHPHHYPQLGGFLLSRVSTLVIPYLFFLCVAAICDYWQQTFSLYDIIIIGSRGTTLWFLQVLFTVEILFYVVQRYLGMRCVALIAILFSLIGYVAYKLDFHLYYHQEVVAQALFYYAWGYIVSVWNKRETMYFGGGEK